MTSVAGRAPPSALAVRRDMFPHYPDHPPLSVTADGRSMGRARRVSMQLHRFALFDRLKSAT
jgi:hypothetical protein